MNANDKRSTIKTKDVFEQDGTFKTNSETGEAIGRELLERKLIGYVSFVRGENPYSFPYRMLVSDYDKANSITPYPKTQFNGTEIKQPIKNISIYFTPMGDYQQLGYDYIISELKKSVNKKDELLPSFENMEKFGYTMLNSPLQSLNIIYPDDGFVAQQPEMIQDQEGKYNSPSGLIGKEGLDRIMVSSEENKLKGSFEYVDIERYGRIFSPSEIGKYSGKIKRICEKINGSTGVVLIYSNYIYGGLIPLALALEEIGFTRAGKGRTLFKTSPPTNNAKYVMITGDKTISPDNIGDLKLLTSLNNKDGNIVKVVLISKTGSEGLDFKFIRQVHILDPWYNMSRIEQIIGRADRTCSHKDLPFKHRNIEIYMHGTIMKEKRSEEEAVDAYIYRFAELKAIQIGIVTKLLKEISVDCILNYKQGQFTADNMKKTVLQELSSGVIIQDYRVGDKPYSSICDYMESCDYKCRPYEKIEEKDTSTAFYNKKFMFVNSEKIMKRVRALIKERFFYTKGELVSRINANKLYPLSQIDYVLNRFITDTNEYIHDTFGRPGHLINIGDMYLFHPIEIINSHISLKERSTPLHYKNEKISMKLQDIPDEDRYEEKKGLSEDYYTRPLIVQPQMVNNNKNNNNDAVVVAPSTDELDGKGDYPRIKGKLFQKMYKNYTDSIGVDDDETKEETRQGDEWIVRRGEENWFKVCKIVILNMVEKGIINRELAVRFLIAHMIEELTIDEHLMLLNEFLSAPVAPVAPVAGSPASLEQGIQAYFLDKMIVKSKAILLYDKSVKKKPAKQYDSLMDRMNEKGIILYVLKGNTWSKSEFSDYSVYEVQLNAWSDAILKKKTNNRVGFMSVFKDNDVAIFKTKDMDVVRNKGARCDQTQKTDIIKQINSIISLAIDSPNSGRILKGIERIPDKTKKSRTELCIIQEFYLRLLQGLIINDKKWFLTQAEVSFKGLE